MAYTFDPVSHEPVYIPVNSIGSCDLTGASLNMKIISSISDEMNIMNYAGSIITTIT